MKAQKVEGSASLDAIDRRILAHLQAEPDLTMADLAERVGLSHTPCWRRLKRMEEAGIVRGRALILNAEALGFNISVFAHIKLKNHEEESLDRFEDRWRAPPDRRVLLNERRKRLYAARPCPRCRRL